MGLKEFFSSLNFRLVKESLNTDEYSNRLKIFAPTWTLT